MHGGLREDEKSSLCSLPSKDHTVPPPPPPPENKRKRGCGRSMTAARFKLPNWRMMHKDFARGTRIAMLLAKAKIETTKPSNNRELVKTISIPPYNTV